MLVVHGCLRGLHTAVATAALKSFGRKLQLLLYFVMLLVRPQSLSRAQASLFCKRLQHCIKLCCGTMQVQHRLKLFCNCLSCFCRKDSTIAIADIASTLLVMLWLMYIIHVTLRENEEDAQSTLKPVRVSEFLKVNAVYHQQFLAAVWFASQCHAVSPRASLVISMQPHASQMLMHAANHVRSLCNPSQLVLHNS